MTGLVTDAGTVLLNNDLHTDDTMLTALNLRQLVFSTDTRFDYAFTGSISDSRDVDFYRLTAPTPAAGQANVLTAMVWGKEANGLLPRVTVFDGFGNEVRAEVLVNDGISYTVQVPNAVAGATYFVRVRAANAQGTRNTGNYFLGVDFSAQAAELETMAGGSLDQTAPQQTGTLTVTEDQMFHFVLSADRADVTITLTVFDRSDHAVATLAARGGEAVSLDLFLAAGAYTFQFTATATNGGPLPKTNYLLRASSISKPIGPEPADPTSSPTGTQKDASTQDYYWSGPGTSGTSSGGTTSSPSGGSSYPSGGSTSDPYGTEPGYSDPYYNV